MPTGHSKSSRSLFQRFLDNEPNLARSYAVLAGLALVQTVIMAPTGQRLLATILAIVLLPVASAMMLFVVGLQIVINPIWGPTATRIFMSIVMLLAPPMVVAAFVLFFFAPPEILSAGNAAVTGWVGFAWAAHFLYYRHGLGQPISPLRFWNGAVPHRPAVAPSLES
jgi:hypothetical protein